MGLAVERHTNTKASSSVIREAKTPYPINHCRHNNHHQKCPPRNSLLRLSASPADYNLWSTFVGRSSSTSKHSTRFTSNRIRGEPDEEAAIDSILAPYHAKEVERRKSNASDIDKASSNVYVPSTVCKTAPGEPPRAMFNLIRSFINNLVIGSG
jgi:hypothetical protein